MSLRGLWILDTSSKENVVAFKRQFPSVEKRAQMLQGSDYILIPANFPELVIDSLNLHTSEHKFSKKYDSCAIEKTPPVVGVLNNKLWPIVILVKVNLVFFCLVLVDRMPAEGTPVKFSDYPGIPLGYSVLQNLLVLIDGVQDKLEMSSEAILRMQEYVLAALPFGTPSEVDVSTVRAILSTKDCVALPKMKTPSWRPIAYKGKQRLTLVVKEGIRAVQYGRSSLTDVCQIFGTINCKADVEDCPEVILSVSGLLETAVLSQMAYHPSVQLSDELTALAKESEGGHVHCASRKLRFCPPLDRFAVCHYSARVPGGVLPIQGYYKMKGDMIKVDILLQLKLAESVKNDFELCDVHIPFFNRGPLKNVKCVPPSANVLVHPNRSELLWNIGSKFPKSRDLTLEIAVEFSKDDVQNKDDFLIGLNSFVTISMKLTDFTYSGLRIDSKSIELSPSCKVKSQITYEFESVDYRIWNILGSVISATKPTE